MNEEGKWGSAGNACSVINIQMASTMNSLGPVACNTVFCGSEWTTNTDYG